MLGGDRLELESSLADVSDPGARVHLYGKDVRPGRKVGHVTVMGADRTEVYDRAVAAATIVKDGGAQ